MTNKTLWQILFEDRHLMSQVSLPDDFWKLIHNKETVTVYCGVDPTADSIHVGHLIPFLTLKKFMEYGHKGIIVIGDGTAMIGDPTGKTEMRTILSREEILHNAEKITQQLQKILPNARFVYNSEWLMSMGYIDALRDIGPYIRVNDMIKSETYKTRMEREEGLTFLEFNYQILQAYDFFELYRRYGCNVQIGGSDQWTNILAGAQLIHRALGQQAFACTVPLLVNKEGKKMGKTERGALWLDKEKTSVYEFYQYWVNIPDDTLEQCLKIFTDIDSEKIDSINSANAQETNEWKKTLAFEITKLVHGLDEADRVKIISEKLFSGVYVSPNDIDLTPTIVSIDTMSSIVDILVAAHIYESKTSARKGVESETVSINGEKITLEYNIVQHKGQNILIKVGKKQFYKLLIN